MESKMNQDVVAAAAESPEQTPRRRFLRTAAAIAATPAIGGFPAIVRGQGQKRFLRPVVAGLNAKQGDPTYNSIAYISRILKEKHGIDMQLQLHPSSTLGTDISQLEAVQTGFIDITSHTTAAFSPFSKAFDFIDLPYSIGDWDMATRVFKSELWRKAAAQFEKDVPAMKVLPAVGAGGFRMLWNAKRPLKGPADVAGLKFRTSAQPLEINLIKAWGGNPTPMAFTEVYGALKNGIIDGIHNQPIWTYVFKLHEVLKYATEVKAYFTVQLQVINKNTFNSMPADIQKAFMAAAQEAADLANVEDRKLEAEYMQKLREAKIEIHTPTAAEAKVWRDLGEGLWNTTGKDVPRDFIKDLIALR
jgi:tripartite ATP-independent transporter DctP family solute receptor